MSDSLGVWRSNEVVKAYGLPEQSMDLVESGCVQTPFGLARPFPYQGNPELLQSLGPLLAGLGGKLGRLSLSRILITVSGQYLLTDNGQALLVSTWESGPVCDTHNTFELFTILAGVAHWHQLTIQPGRRVLDDWQQRYAGMLAESLQLTRHPDLNKRALHYWEELMDTWRNCIREGLAVVSQVEGCELSSCLSLGVENFSDFIYLADLHRAHYNRVDRCRVGLPTEDLTALLKACEGDLRVMESMLLSYTKVRNLSLAEQRLILAELWFPDEVSLEELQAPNLNILALRRMQGALERRMALISDLEDVLCLSAVDQEQAEHGGEPADDQDDDEEVLTVAQKGTKSGSRKVVEVAEVRQPFVSQEVAEAGQIGAGSSLLQAELETAIEEQSEAIIQAVEEVEPMEEEKLPVEQEDVAVATELAEAEETATKPAKRVMVWKPFPRPLNAPPEPPVLEQPAEQVQPEEESEEEPAPPVDQEP